MNKRDFLTLILSVLVMSACNIVSGSGNVITESRNVANFDRVSLSSSSQVILTQEDQESLQIEAEDNIIPLIETVVRNGQLNIGTRNNVIINTTKPIKVYVSMVEISGLDVSGSGSIQVANLATDDLTLGISGSGEVSIASLTAEGLQADISGSGTVDLAGQMAEQTIDISGSGEYNAADLESQMATVSISGSGQASIWVTDSLDVSMSGSGEVEYRGQPTLNLDTSGSGQIIHRED